MCSGAFKLIGGAHIDDRGVKGDFKLLFKKKKKNSKVLNVSVGQNICRDRTVLCIHLLQSYALCAADQIPL